jgi:hypothetical protein
VGADLFGQVVQQERDGGARQLIASGTSCTEQLQAGFARTVLHPIELLASLLAVQEPSAAKVEEEDKELESDLESVKRARREESNS